MYQPRVVESDSSWLDSDGVKIYTISAKQKPVDTSAFHARLSEVKALRTVAWSNTPAFAIFHDGSSALYLVLAWWGNDNEMFTSVSVRMQSGWVEDPSRFSFCLWDLEVMWHERNAFVEFVYCANPNLAAYRTSRLANKAIHATCENARV
jgi:hypothetical protein